MNVVRIESGDDPRLRPYRNLKDRELAREGGLFIAEGEHVVRRLLASDFPVESVLLAERRVERVAPAASALTPVYAVTEALVHEIVGFHFHSGILACGRRKPNPPLDALLGSPTDLRPRTLVVCPEIINHENVGTIVRVAAAFGAAGVVLGRRSCDPFWRRSIRVSMGSVFTMPIRVSEDLQGDLARMKSAGFVTLATVLDADALPLAKLHRPPRLALLLGSEAQGLDAATIAACDLRVTIPMQLGTDSLNVTIAAAVCLHHLTQVASPVTADILAAFPETGGADRT